MKKRMISLALSILMLLSMIPTTVFAEGDVSITVGNVTANAGETVAVPVTISGATNAKFANMVLSFTVSPGLTITGATIGDEAKNAGMSISDSSNYESGIVILKGASAGSSPADGTLLTLSVSVAESATGAMTITAGPKDSDTGNISDYDENDVICTFATGSVTVGTTTPEVTEPYTATLSSTASNVTNGQPVSVTVTVGGKVGTYNAAEIALSYPTNILTYNSIETNSDEISVDSNVAGKLYIVDKGSENAANTTYTLKFDSIAAGTNNVILDSAYFGTRADSQTANLTEATIVDSPLSITVNPKTFAVTFPDDEIATGKLFETEQTPTEGVDFVFTAANSNYDYSNVVVKVGESENTAVEIPGVTAGQDNSWTVPGNSITGNLYVTATATPTTYGVSYSYVDKDGNTQSGVANDATYGTNYVYTMPEGVAPSGTTDGFHYVVDTVKINGVVSSAYSENVTTREVTVTGTAITGPVEITLKKATDTADSWAVAVEADPSITVGEYSVASSVTKGEKATLTIIPQPGYTYTVTAKYTESGNAVELTKDGNSYTTTNGVTANITFVIAKAVDTTSFIAELYLEGGMGESKDQNMYLVKIGTKLDVKHYTCNGNAMFWSEKYDANCYLVIAGTAPAVNDLTFAIVDDAAVEVSYDKDVNESTSDTVDANDAQLAYDMYNKVYNVTTEDVTVWKFLKADVNGDSKLDTNDAADIVDAVLTRMKSAT